MGSSKISSIKLILLHFWFPLQICSTKGHLKSIVAMQLQIYHNHMMQNFEFNISLMQQTKRKTLKAFSNTQIFFSFKLTFLFILSFFLFFCSYVEAFWPKQDKNQCRCKSEQFYTRCLRNMSVSIFENSVPLSVFSTWITLWPKKGKLHQILRANRKSKIYKCKK